MGNNQRQSFALFFPLKLALSSWQTFFYAVKCNLLDPNKIGMQLSQSSVGKEVELSSGESGLKHSLFCYSENTLKEMQGRPHNSIVVCTCFWLMVKRERAESGTLLWSSWWSIPLLSVRRLESTRSDHLFSITWLVCGKATSAPRPIYEGTVCQGDFFLFITLLSGSP